MTQPELHTRRLVDLADDLAELELDLMVVSSVHNVTWLTGFTGDSSLVVVHRDGAVLLTDSRYTEQAERETTGLVVREQHDGLTAELVSVVAETGARRVGLESAHVTLKFRDTLEEKLSEAGLAEASLVGTDEVVERRRMIKTPTEVEAIRQAIEAAERGLAEVLSEGLPQVTEKQFADRLEFAMRRHGASCSSFEPIVAYGPNRSLPHYRPGDVAPDRSAPVLVDWGARVGVFNSDLTRVFYHHSMDDFDREIYPIVLEAQRRAIECIAPGVTAGRVDAVARDYIAERGYGEHFGHSLGHGVGLQVHEEPGIRKTSTRELVPGMVFTVEPGIYVPGRGGVRIEDMVLVTDDGVEVLTGYPKDPTAACLAER